MVADNDHSSRESQNGVHAPEGSEVVRSPEVDFPIVAIGASAGGLEALEVFFSNMPSDANMAFVVIQHLSPKHKSIMGLLLEKHTDMKIQVAEDGVKLKPNHVYLNPPEKNLAIMHKVICLMEPPYIHSLNLPIDYFFQSLSDDQGERSICIILSGTGTDGTKGLRAIKGVGGMAMVQDEKQARYNGMPSSAIGTGLVDYVLPVEEMPHTLIRYVRHPYVEGQRQSTISQDKLNRIFMATRHVTGHDFSHYKKNTICRRLQRRMAVHQIEDIDDYIRYFQQTPTEVRLFFKDMLIGVTKFFRDKNAFEFLKETVLWEMLKDRPYGSNLRIWVAGCATGEEAYSICIIVAEVMKALKGSFNVQVFATDIDSEAIAFARAGIYPQNISADVSDDRLTNYFSRDNDTYRVKKEIRQMVVFSEQNIIKDPPFSKLDLISCRNVLIYMESTLQKKLIPMLHYTLNPGGYLFLGTSESIGEFSGMFSAVDSKLKIFKRSMTSTDANNMLFNFNANVDTGTEIVKSKPTDLSIRNIAEKIIIEDYASPGVLINDKSDIIFYIGNTGAYLMQPTGEPTTNILKLVSEEIRYALSAVIHGVVTRKKTVIKEGLKLKHNNHTITFNIIARPLIENPQTKNMIMIVFEEKSAMKGNTVKKKVSKKEPEENSDIIKLQQELQATKEYLQATIEELESSNEELRSTNEEMQSTNEELQSANEELETSKEELHSTNEELETVNAELQNKLNELSRVNDDLNNLMAGTEIATIFLDNKLCIKRFTKSVLKIFNLRQSDVGRPISDITINIEYPSLYEDAKTVLDTLSRKRIDVVSNIAQWYTVSIIPYRTLENVIDGVVITFMDITELKSTIRFSERIIDAMRDPILILDVKLNVISSNKSFHETFKVDKADIINRAIDIACNGQWDIPELRGLLEATISQGRAFNGFIAEREFKGIGLKRVLLNGRRVDQGDHMPGLILLYIEDITIDGRDK